MTNIEFINKVKTQAIADMKQYGILASLTIAQAILESGWGKSGLAIKSNNLFGIKWTSDFRGGKDLYKTQEYVNGKPIMIDAYFRKYNNWSESITDHTKILLQERYKKLIGVRDYIQACKIVKECGYATDINYPSLLITIIEENKLYTYDTLSTPVTSKMNDVYIVKSGDTLSGIAEQFNVDLSTLAKFNNIIDVDKIFVGQVIRLNTTVYCVQKGDTLTKIAMKYGVTTQKLITMNKIPNPNLITIGQLIRIR